MSDLGIYQLIEQGKATLDSQKKLKRSLANDPAAVKNLFSSIPEGNRNAVARTKR